MDPRSSSVILSVLLVSPFSPVVHEERGPEVESVTRNRRDKRRMNGTKGMSCKDNFIHLSVPSRFHHYQSYGHNQIIRILYWHLGPSSPCRVLRRLASVSSRFLHPSLVPYAHPSPLTTARRSRGWATELVERRRPDEASRAGR